MGGSAAWLRRAGRARPATTLVLGLDTLGAGEPRVLDRRGAAAGRAHYRDEDVELADRGAAAGLPRRCGRRLDRPDPRPLRGPARDLALSVSRTAASPNYHVPTDTPRPRRLGQSVDGLASRRGWRRAGRSLTPGQPRPAERSKHPRHPGSSAISQPVGGARSTIGQSHAGRLAARERPAHAARPAGQLRDAVRSRGAARRRDPRPDRPPQPERPVDLDGGAVAVAVQLDRRHTAAGQRPVVLEVAEEVEDLLGGRRDERFGLDVGRHRLVVACHVFTLRPGDATMARLNHDDSAFESLMVRLDHPMFLVTTSGGGERAGCLVGFAAQTQHRSGAIPGLYLGQEPHLPGRRSRRVHGGDLVPGGSRRHRRALRRRDGRRHGQVRRRGLARRSRRACP